MTENTNTSKVEDSPVPKVGEVRRLTGFSWDPWVIVTRVDSDEAGKTAVRFAILDEMNDGALAPVPPELFHRIEETVGNKWKRREVAEKVDVAPDIDKRWCPADRLAVLGGPGIQGVDYDG